MACFSGTNIVQDGLVFAYDMGNVKKSWRGKPTINLTTNAPSENGWQGSYTLVDSDTKTFNIETSRSSVTEPSSAWRSWYWDVSAYVGQTVTISGNVEFVSETNASFQDISIGQGNTGSFPFHIAGSDPADRVTVTTKPVEKLYMAWTGVINATGIVGFTQWINNVTVNNGNSILRISEVQIEVNNFATPFVNGTRSNTQAIVDLTGDNTINANSLTYNPDNTFEFNGINDSINLGNVDLITTAFSIETWFKGNATQTGAYNSIVTKDISGSFGSFAMASDDNNNYIRFGYNGTLGQREVSGAGTVGANDLKANTWVHYCGTWDGSNLLSLYRNGELIKTTTGANGEIITGNSSDLLIGDRTAADGFFGGLISMIRIYNNKTLSAAEIQQNFEAYRRRYGI